MPHADDITAFLFKHYSVEELADLGRRALRYFFPPLGDEVEVAKEIPPTLADRVVVRDCVGHPATALCAYLLLKRQVPCSELVALDEATSQLLDEVQARLRQTGLTLARDECFWRLYWIEEQPRNRRL